MIENLVRARGYKRIPIGSNAPYIRQATREACERRIIRKIQYIPTQMKKTLTPQRDFSAINYLALLRLFILLLPLEPYRIIRLELVLVDHAYYACIQLQCNHRTTIQINVNYISTFIKIIYVHVHFDTQFGIQFGIWDRVIGFVRKIATFQSSKLQPETEPKSKLNTSKF